MFIAVYLDSNNGRWILNWDKVHKFNWSPDEMEYLGPIFWHPFITRTKQRMERILDTYNLTDHWQPVIIEETESDGGVDWDEYEAENEIPK